MRYVNLFEAFPIGYLVWLAVSLLRQEEGEVGFVDIAGKSVQVVMGRHASGPEGT